MKYITIYMKYTTTKFLEKNSKKPSGSKDS